MPTAILKKFTPLKILKQFHKNISTMLQQQTLSKLIEVSALQFLTAEFIVTDKWAEIDLGILHRVWVIDDLARLRRAILGRGRGGHFCPTVLMAQVCVYSTKLAKTFYRAIIDTQEVCFHVRISCRIIKRGWFKVEWWWKRLEISHILTPPPGK